MSAWAASPYASVGVYIGGINRGCAQANLTAGWVSQQIGAGWSLLPVYVGRQAPCTSAGWARISTTQASAQGTAAAQDAVDQANALGLAAATPVYLDLEYFSTANASCTNAVLTYVSAWTAELHTLHHRSGIYSSSTSGIAAVNTKFGSTSYHLPDDIWFARWNGHDDDVEPLVTTTRWALHRVHQYVGDHDETYGGYRYRIDADLVHGDVATRTPPAGAKPFRSWDGFHAQQLLDLSGTTGTLHSRAATVGQLTAGTLTPTADLQHLIKGSWFAPHLAPVARLYWAYFGRIPDYGGLSYWSAKHRTGTHLETISQGLATSHEFLAKYGTLSNHDFVTRIYADVLVRAADPNGVAYWTNQLDTGARNRGTVMTGFSESAEYVRKQAAAVNVSLDYAALLHRAPTPSELTAVEPLATNVVLTRLLATPEYATRVA